MIRVDDARARMLAALEPTEPVGLDYAATAGRVLARPVTAQRTQPPFDASAMDGYAVRSSDLRDASVTLTLAGEAAAGHGWAGRLSPDQAVRISTGAPVPDGADQVVIQENTERAGDQLIITDRPRPGAHIRRAGCDFTENEILLDAGQIMSAEAIALAVSAGITMLDVHRQPRIGILSTGDELVEPGHATGPDQIINSVSKALAALVERAGCTPVYLGIARDDPDSVRTHLDAGRTLDLVVTIGGASVGDHDHLRRLFAEDGGALVFEKIALKPGKPTWFGKLGGTPYLGLPGNPVSALVVARLLLLPALARLNGCAATPIFTRARLGIDLPANDHRETFLRAKRDSDGIVHLVDSQDSSVLSALVQANCLIRRPVNAPPAKLGDLVDVLPLEDRN